MKVLLLLTLSSLCYADWTCKECQTMTSAIRDLVSTKEDIQTQIDLLLVEVCPQVQDVEGCKKDLPDFWKLLAPTLWEGVFYTPEVCKGCLGKTSRSLTCKECQVDLKEISGAMKDPKSIKEAVDFMSGPYFCEFDDQEVELCQAAIAEILPLAFNAFAAVQDDNEDTKACKEVLGVC